MATNIGASATMTLTNMKPAAGEQVDSLWGQNIADNTGYLRARPVGWVQDVSGGGTSNSAGHASTSSTNVLLDYPYVYFYRTPGHNMLRGTFSGSGTFSGGGVTPDIYYNFGPVVVGDLGTYRYSQLSGSYSNVGSSHTFGSTWNVDVDISAYVSEGSFATMLLEFQGRSTDYTGTHTISVAHPSAMNFVTYWA